MTNIGYEIKDLRETSLDLFQKEVEHWKILGAVSKDTIRMVSFCDFLLGPFLLKAKSELSPKYPSFERVYTDLPPHNTVGITGIFWYFEKNTRDPSEFFASLSINSGYDLKLPTVVPTPESLEEFDQTERFDLAFSNRFKYVNHHESSTLAFRVDTLIQEDSLERSFGFRELTVHFSNFSRKIEHSMMCHEPQGLWSLTLNECPCPLNQFLDSSQICQRCAKNCDVCFGPEPLHCLSCAYGTHWDGKKCNMCHPNCQTCNGANEYSCQVCTFGFYNHRNGTCSETCESPFIKIKGFHEHYCRRGCKPGEYEWDYYDTCLAECDLPLIKSPQENGRLTCNNPCSRNDFLYTNGSCLSICPAPLLSVFQPRVKFCKNPCESNSDYLYSNRSCLKECHPPLQIKAEPGVNYCINPCHSTNLYLYGNGSCLSSCHAPLKSRTEFGVKYCQMPCDLAREFILTDGSCSKECPSNFIKKKEPSIGTYCLSPCESKDHFLSQNGSYLANCSKFSEIRREYGLKYCVNPCSADQYYFSQNKSCLNNCPSPFLVAKNEGINLCQNPCFGMSNFFLYDDQSCYETCPLPLASQIIGEQEVRYCKSPCSTEYVNEDGSCRKSCEYPFEASQKGPYKLCMIRRMTTSQLLQVDSIRHSVEISTTVSRIGGVLNSVLNAGDSTSILIMPLFNMFETVGEIRIGVSGNLGFMLNERLLKESFEKRLVFLGIICSITLLLKAIRTQENSNKIVLILQKCSFAFQWNILIPAYISVSGDMILFSLTELQKFQMNAWTLSYMLLILLAILVSTKIIQVARSGFETERWRFVYEIYRSESLGQQLFVFIYFLRVVLVSVILSFGTNYPHIQIFTLMIISFGMIFYLVYTSPIQKAISKVQHMITEIALLFYHILLGISMVLFNFEDEKSINIKNVLGHLMAILYLITPLITGIVIVFKLLKNIYDYYQRENSRLEHIELSHLSNGDQSVNENSMQVSNENMRINDNDGRSFDFL